MDELEEDLRATAQSIESDADRLASIEDEEAAGIARPATARVSREAEFIAKRLSSEETVAERELAVETQG